MGKKKKRRRKVTFWNESFELKMFGGMLNFIYHIGNNNLPAGSTLFSSKK